MNKLIDLKNFTGIFLYVMLVVIIAWLLSRLIRFIILQIIKSKQSDKFGKTSIQFLRNSIKFFVGILAIAFIVLTVPVFRSKATLIFSGAGILAAIIGFAAQAALSNLIAGAFIVFFRPFRVGDYVRLDDTRMGVIEDITLRHTVINNFENKRLIIPNSVISSDSILNHTIEDSHILSFNNFKIGLKADIDLARKIIQQEAPKINGVIDNRTPEQVLTNPQVVVRLIEIYNDYIHLRAYVWINDPFEEFKIKCELKENVYKRFVKERVDLPIPIYKIVDIEKTEI